MEIIFSFLFPFLPFMDLPDMLDERNRKIAFPRNLLIPISLLLINCQRWAWSESLSFFSVWCIMQSDGWLMQGSRRWNFCLWVAAFQRVSSLHCFHLAKEKPRSDGCSLHTNSLRYAKILLLLLVAWLGPLFKTSLLWRFFLIHTAYINTHCFVWIIRYRCQLDVTKSPKWIRLLWCLLY